MPSAERWGCSSPHIFGSSARNASRHGFTLVEMMVVLLILGVAAAAVAPALLQRTEPEDPVERTAEELASLLRSARSRAVGGGRAMVFLLDPASGRYWLSTVEGDTAGGGQGILTRAPGVTLSASAPRARFVFTATGGAWGEPITVSGTGGGVVVTVDLWTGDADVHGR